MTLAETTTELRKRRNTHTRAPSTNPPDGDKLEEVLLYKLDNFLYTVESRLDEMEEYGLQKLTQVDESVQHAYETLVKVRNEVIGEGWRKAEALLKVVEDQLPIPETNLSARMAQGISFLEERLAHIEHSCFDAVDGTMTIGIQTALQAASTGLLTYDQLPLLWRDNPYILRGYRFSKGYMDCVSSIIKVHNETCNIWTHLIGLFAMLGLAFYHWPTTLSWSQATAMDKLTMAVFLVAATKCLVCSVMWHTFCSYSRPKMKENFACIDYTGIVILIAASIMTTEYAALYCRPLAQSVYMTSTAVCGLVGAYCTWKPVFNSPGGRMKRLVFFISFVLGGLLGFVHAGYFHGFVNTFWFYFPVFKSVACYSLGVVVYSTLFPERYFPGTIFDYFGMSHNLWHLAVFGGIYLHYTATIHLLENARAYSCPVH
ncbi:hypothetical protein TRVA0_075S00254 [Trichomonascus vanleenenianus]|uniref:Izh3p n=1 Tax=Trichomonascus vanleenenianus TaxID=2268995 RepID=UPI003ECA7F03